MKLTDIIGSLFIAAVALLLIMWEFNLFTQ